MRWIERKLKQARGPLRRRRKASGRTGPGALPPFARGSRIALRGGLLAFAVVACAAAQVQPAGANRFVVVLDAAHGGDDAGATLPSPTGSPEAEKNWTLALSVRLRSLLAARGFAVVTTRESDVTLDAERRAEIANHAGAQACLVLHAAMSGTGVHLFISSLEPAAPRSFIPWKTAQAAWVPRSVALAGVLNSALLHAGATVTLGRTALTTVDSMTCPAVAIEVAPESPAHGSEPAAELDDPGYQARVAEALAAGLLEWRATTPAKSGQAGEQQP